MIATGPDFVRYLMQQRNFYVEMITGSSVAATPGYYTADGLTTNGRMLGFLADEAFVDAYREVLSEQVDNPGYEILRGLVWRKSVLLWAARSAATVPGCFVECGAGGGFGVDVLRRSMGASLGSRRWYLYDTYDGVPDVLMDPGFRDPHGTGQYEAVCELFADTPSIVPVRGLLPGTLADSNPEPVAFAHIDLNNARSELETVRSLWDRLSPGAVLVFDDYGWALFSLQHNSLRALFDMSGIPVLEIPTGQGLVVKRDGDSLADFDTDELLEDAAFRGVPNWEQLSNPSPASPDVEFDNEFDDAIAYFDAQKAFLVSAEQPDLATSELINTRFERRVDDGLVAVATPIAPMDQRAARIFLQFAIDALQGPIDALHQERTDEARRAEELEGASPEQHEESGCQPRSPED